MPVPSSPMLVNAAMIALPNRRRRRFDFPAPATSDWTTIPSRASLPLPESPPLSHSSWLSPLDRASANTPSLYVQHRPIPTPSVLSVHAESKRDASAHHCSPVSSSSKQSSSHRPPPFNSSH